MKTYRYEEFIGANLRRLRERDHPEWSMNKVAAMLTARGIKIDATGVKRIEEGNRGVKFNEAVAIRDLLGVRMEDLTIDPRLAANHLAQELVEEWLEAYDEHHTTVARLQRAQQAIEDQLHSKGSAGLREALEVAMAHAVLSEGVPEDADERRRVSIQLATLVLEATGDEETYGPVLDDLLAQRRKARSNG